MLNSGSSKLDEILAVGRSNKEHLGLRYIGFGKTSSAQAVFVKASTSCVKKIEDIKLKATLATLVR